MRRRKLQCSGLTTYVKPSLMLVPFCSCLAVYKTAQSVWATDNQTSICNQTLHRGKKSSHAAIIELSPWQKFAVTNEIRALCKLHLLSWSSNYITQRVQQMLASYYLMFLINISSAADPYSVRRVQLARRVYTVHWWRKMRCTAPAKLECTSKCNVYIQAFQV